MKKLVSLFTVLALVLIGVSFAHAAEAEQRKLKIGFVYVSPVGDAGWSYAHDVARKALEAQGHTTIFVEAVAAGPDCERVLVNMARGGCDLIFATSFGFMDPTIKVAKQFPEVKFMHCTGFKTAANVSNYFGRIYQARYLTGMLAGLSTSSNKVGYVAAFPIPEVIRGINAFALGVRSVKPEAEVRVVWTKTWYDPATEKEAAKSLVDVGCDVLTQHQDSLGVQEAAQELSVRSIGYNTDMAKFAPDSHMTAAVWNWLPYYETVVKQVQDGTWEPGSYWPGLEAEIIDLAPYAAFVPQEHRDVVDAKKEAIRNGDYIVFSGPVADQEDTVRIAEGQQPTDEELLRMDWFVKGVIGSSK